MVVGKFTDWRLHLLGVKILEERGKSLDARFNPGWKDQTEHQQLDDITQSMTVCKK